MFKVEIRKNKVYLCNIGTDWNNPRMILTFWETNAYPYEGIEKLDVIEIAFAKCVNYSGKLIPLNPINEIPSFIEFQEIKKPRGKYTWKNGEWKKQK